MSRTPLRGRTVVVTGAARGIGAALARDLARRGARIALLGHERTELEAVADSLPVPALAHEVDITDDAALDRAAELVRTRLGVPSAVVANAGVAESGPFITSDPAEWRRVIDVNLTGSAATARAFLPDLLATRGYHLQVASLAALGAAPMMSAYCASKAGAEAFAHSLRAEVAHRGVAVGIGYMSWTDTDMIRDGDRYAALRELRCHMPPPVRRLYSAEQVATRLGAAVEHRSTAVYIPRWLCLAQAIRAALPPLVLRVTRHQLPRLETRSPLSHTGLLGPGGQADRTTPADPPRPTP